jgi:isopentenyl phosphate kinase
MIDNQLIFIKLGGSLITDKMRSFTPRLDTLRRLAAEIAEARALLPGLRLIIGHGSGSFGHVPAQEYKTHDGVSTSSQWEGFSAVWREARTLNQLVIQAMLDANLPVIAFPPSSCVLTQDHSILSWDTRPIKAALDANLIPVVNGDVTFDAEIGGTILSTEEAFYYLAECLYPQRILLAGMERGVWKNFPECTEVIPTITPLTYNNIKGYLSGSMAVDVTGGMLQKVSSMVELVSRQSNLQISIFSGDIANHTLKALLGEKHGTLISDFENLHQSRIK